MSWSDKESLKKEAQAEGKVWNTDIDKWVPRKKTHIGENIGKMAKHLKDMQSEPASKEWFAKYGTPKKKAMAKKMKGMVDRKHFEKILAQAKGQGLRAGMGN